MYQERLLPHSIEAEEAVISSLLIDGDSAYKVTGWLRPEDFYSEKNRRCYDACMNLHKKGVGINRVTVSEELARAGHLEAIGGAAYLAHILASATTSVHLESYGQIVRRHADARRLIQAAGRIAGLAYECPDDMLPQAREVFTKLLADSNQGGTGFESLSQIIDKEMGKLDEWVNSQNEISGLATNLRALDWEIDGLQKATLYMLAARPGHGKTQLALIMARNLAAEGRRVAIFSLEMSKSQLLKRLAQAEGRVNRFQLRKEPPGSEAKIRFWDAIDVVGSLSIMIDDTSKLTTSEAEGRLATLMMVQPIDVVMVDYLQLFRDKAENRLQQVTQIGQALKGWAKQFNVPVVAACQINRKAEERDEKRPQLADMRDSGTLEQDADVVLGLYRPALIFTEEQWDKRHLNTPYPKNILEIGILKQRDGPGGEWIKIYWDVTTGRMADLKGE